MSSRPMQMQTIPVASEVGQFRSRMEAQICLIENYRKEQLIQTGRLLSRDEAAAEWITRFAADFPHSIAA
ncbi:MAG: hypothetical protein ACE5E3_01865 [Mariprofundus sp.]